MDHLQLLEKCEPKYNILGLIFFIPIVKFNIRGIIALFVIFNGILCHGSNYFNHKYSKCLTYYDITCNVIFGLFILFTETKYKIFIFIIQFMSVCIFILNKLRYNSSSLLHIFGVQFPLSIVLSYYSLSL